MIGLTSLKLLTPIPFAFTILHALTLCNVAHTELVWVEQVTNALCAEQCFL